MKIEELVEFAERCSSFPSYLTIWWTQINKKNLYVSEKLRDRFYLIKSYNTIVGVVDDETKQFLEIGKHSPTTSKQVTFIYRNRFSDCERLFTPTKLKEVA